MGTHDATSWWLILNGKAAGDDAVREAVQAVRDAGQPINVRVTWEAGDDARCVEEAMAAQAAVVIAGGGDGTVNAVVSALAASGRAADALPVLGVLPLGTANDFATAAGIPAEPLAALQALCAAQATAVDVLEVTVDGETRWAMNVVSGGFGAQVTVETNESLKSLLGGLAYVITGLGKLGRIEPMQARIDAPEVTWAGEFIALGIGNGRQAGGGQVLCPQARIDDGLIDLTVVPPLGGDLLSTLGTAVSEGKEAALDKAALQWRVPWLELTAAEPLPFNLDGEPVQARALRVDCHARRLRMLLPAACGLVGMRDQQSTDHAQ